MTSDETRVIELYLLRILSTVSRHMLIHTNTSSHGKTAWFHAYIVDSLTYPSDSHLTHYSEK